MAATYITEHLHRYIPARSLRSENANNLVIHKTNTINYGVDPPDLHIITS